MLRLFALRWPVGEVAASRRANAVAAAFAEPWRKWIDRRGVLIFVRDDPHDTPLLALPDECGLIIGQAFARRAGLSSPLYAEDVTQARVLSWLATRGDSFVETCWGPNILVLHNRSNDEFTIIRDAGGARPIFVDRRSSPIMIFTHAEDWLGHAGEITIDRSYLQAFVAQSRIVTPRTGFEGVIELLPGERLTLGRGGAHWDMSWRPPPPSQRGRRREDEAQALRQTVFDCGQAWRRAAGKIMHRLSGGLDSSIVLAALQQGEGGEIVAVNERSLAMPETDEFAFAALSAERWGVRLESWVFDPKAIDYRTLLDVEFGARPSLAALGFADPAALALAERFAGSVVTSGQGGDQIFQRGKAPFLVGDAIRDGLPAEQVLEAARDAASLSRTHIWEMVRNGIGQALPWAKFDPVAHETYPAPLATETGAREAVLLRQTHEWLRHSQRWTPTRRTRVLRAIDLAYYAQLSVLSPRTVNAPVLASRPIMDCAYAIAPYNIVAGGQDRALARRAFADCIPKAVFDRTLKGSTTRFHTIVLERNLPFMRDVLLGGRLVAAGLVNARALEETLAQKWALNAYANANLSNALMAELWFRRLEAACARLPRRADHLEAES